MTMPTKLRLLSLSFLVLLVACGAEEVAPTTSGSDTAATDAATDSSGTVDAGTEDSGTDEDAQSDTVEEEPDAAADALEDATPDADAEDDVCVPECDRVGCYDDGCGGTCENCDDGFVCAGDGSCEPECTPDCSEATCGEDGCGGTCGTCTDPEVCQDGACECVPSCDGLECGDDGCGGSCGECAGDDVCGAGTCVSECTPDCTERVCGSNGCEGSCGECGEGDHCTDDGACECWPACEGISCGDDGCGGSCGECASGFDCSEGGECVCVPNCDGLECGSNGCGGSCGECATECIEGTCAPSADCPPEGPFGTSVGATVPDYTLTRCDGSTVTVHELCGNEANLIIGFAGWCPPCRRNAPVWEAGVTERAGETLGVYFVINENSDFGTPNAAYCNGTAETYGLTMPVLFDPTGGFSSAYGMADNDSTMILNSDLVIIDKGQYESPASVLAEIDALLE